MNKFARSLLVATCLVALAGCQRETSAPTSSNASDVIAEPLPDADINASLEALGPAHNAAEIAAAPSFVGRWAVDQRSCVRTTWRFSDSSLETPAGSVCRFTEVRQVTGGYDISARCTAEAPEQDDLLKLRFAGSAQAMLFESDSIADAGLVRCDAD